MGEWSSIGSLRFKYTYTDNGGHTETKMVGIGVLCALWGYWVQEAVTKEGFKCLTLEVGRRKAIIEPAKPKGKGNRK